MKEKEKQSKALYILYIYLYLLQWMQGNIYRDVFPTFLTKKSYGWWITRRRMEIYTKISKSVGRNYREASGEHPSTVQNGCEIISQQKSDFAAVQHSAFSLE